MAKSRPLLHPLLAGGITFGAIYALGNLSWVQQVAAAKGMAKQLGEVQVSLSGIFSLSMTAIVSLIKNWFNQGNEKQDEKKPAPQPLQYVIPPDVRGTNWRHEYARLYAQAVSLLRARDQSKSELENKLVEADHKLDIALDRRAVLELTLYCGLLMALGSCIVTVLFNPGKTSSVSGSLRHLSVMAGVYFFLAGLLAWFALKFRGRPHRHVPYLMFGVGALYVDFVSLLIATPYSIDRILASPLHVLKMPLVVWIALSRLLVLPLITIAGSWLGTTIARLRVSDPGWDRKTPPAGEATTG